VRGYATLCVALVEDKSLKKSWSKSIITLQKKFNLSMLEISETQFMTDIKKYYKICTKFGQNPLKDVDPRVFTRIVTDGWKVALLYPLATSLARR
jgi:hypothetical protein